MHAKLVAHHYRHAVRRLQNSVIYSRLAISDVLYVLTDF